jgi:hypothetical protein
MTSAGSQLRAAAVEAAALFAQMRWRRRGDVNMQRQKKDREKQEGTDPAERDPSFSMPASIHMGL